MNTMKKLTVTFTFTLIAALLGPSPASWATVTGGAITGGSVLANGGMFQKLTPPLNNPFGTPNSIGNDTFQDNNLYAFDEGQNILVTMEIMVDDLLGPDGAGVVPANSTVASHYIFFDPDLAESVVGTVTFDSDIYGVLFRDDTLGDSDFLINTGVNYLNPNLRGLEANQDAVTILDSRTIEVDFTASTPGDYIRVLTEFSPGAVPEPASAALLGAGMLLATRIRIHRR